MYLIIILVLFLVYLIFSEKKEKFVDYSVFQIKNPKYILKNKFFKPSANLDKIGYEPHIFVKREKPFCDTKK